MAKKKATEKLGLLEEQDVASKLGKQNLDQNKADGQDSDDEDFVNLDYGDIDRDAAEDADNEIDTDDDFEEIRPLNIKKAKTNKDSDPVCLSTNHPEQNTQTSTHAHRSVEWADNLAQAQKGSAEASHTAPIALEHKLPRAPTPYPEPLTVHEFPDLLHPSPPLRRRKGSMALGKKTSESAVAHSMMPKKGENQDALYDHDDQDHVAETSDNSNTYTTPTHRGKMPEAPGNKNTFSGEGKGKAAEMDQSSEASMDIDFPTFTRKTSGFSKAYAILGHSEEETTTPTKSMTNLVTSPKASNEKKSLRNLFNRKGSKDSTSSPSSPSGKTAGRITVSAPTLLNATPNAKSLLDSASPLPKTSPDAKKVINYSRPTAPQPSKNVSNGSPVGHGRSSSGLHDSNPFSGPSTSPEGDSDSFDPSDYSGDENSVQQAVAIPIVASGRAKLVDIRPPRVINTAASGNQSGTGIAVAPGTSNFTDQDAEALGAQDAERYKANAMTLQTHPTVTNTEDPFVDPAFQNLLAKPANEISAKEMARLKAAREAGNMGGGLMERMNALRAKSDAKPRDENSEEKTASTRSNTGENLLSKMRGLGKKSKKGKELEDSEEEGVRQVEADKERGIREEKAINEMIKAKLAAKDAANGGVRGAGIPRIDYGPPTQRTALGGSGPTDEERAHAGALGNRRPAGQTEGRFQKEDNTTPRGQFEGY